MLSKEEKAHISAKIFSWLNSKISLLLIASLITGILVPRLQNTYNSIVWRRENRFTNINFRLKMMRNCLTEFVYLSAYPPDAYARVEPFMDTAPLTPNDYKEFEQQYINLQSRRFGQNAIVTSLTIHFLNAGQVKESLEDYMRYCDRYFRDLRSFVQIKYRISHPTNYSQTDVNEEHLDELGGKIRRDYNRVLNRSYKRVIFEMKEEIGRAEDGSEEFRS